MPWIRFGGGQVEILTFTTYFHGAKDPPYIGEILMLPCYELQKTIHWCNGGSFDNVMPYTLGGRMMPL